MCDREDRGGGMLESLDPESPGDDKPYPRRGTTDTIEPAFSRGIEGRTIKPSPDTLPEDELPALTDEDSSW